MTVGVSTSVPSTINKQLSEKSLSNIQEILKTFPEADEIVRTCFVANQITRIFAALFQVPDNT